MKFAIFGAGIIFACIVLGIVSSSDDTMAKCQEKFSHDVCFQVLNR